jgi:hypothetical protein
MAAAANFAGFSGDSARRDFAGCEAYSLDRTRVARGARVAAVLLVAAGLGGCGQNAPQRLPGLSNL